MMRPLLASASCAALSLGLATGAAAQSSTPPGQAQSDLPSTSVEDVIVTAQRRPESAQRVPLALTVIDGDDLLGANIQTVNDLEYLVPNLEVTSQLGGGQPQFRIRGVGLTDYAANNTGTVTVYVDEVAYPYGSMIQGPLFDVSRIEVLRGPQGTLYGRNTTGGAVSIITNAPTRDFSAGANMSYGRYDAVHADGFVSGALTDTLAARLAFTVDQGGAWQFNRDTGEELGDQDRWAVRVRFDWRPDDRTVIDASLRYNRDQSDGLGLRLRAPFQDRGPVPPGPPLRLYPVDTDNRITGWGISPFFAGRLGVGLDAKPFRDNEGTGASVRLVRDFDFATLTTVFAYEQFDRKEFNDWDAVRENEAGVFFFNDIEVLSGEARLTSRTEGRFSWLAGLYGSREEIGGGFESDFSDAFGTAGAFRTVYNQEVSTVGVYGNAEYDLTERINFNLGLRYEDEQRELIGFQSDRIFSANPANRAPFPLARADRSLDMGEWSGKVGAEYGFTDQILGYASVARGVKSGGFTTYNSPLPDQLNPFDPEKLIAYEVGLKSSWLEDTLQVNLAAFYYDYEDLQLQGILYSETARVGRIVNVPSSYIWGSEIEVAWRPIERLVINQSLGYKYGEYSEFLFANSALTEAPSNRDPVTGAFRQIFVTDRAGERLPFPRVDYKGSIRYSQPLGGWQVDVGTNYAYRSELFSTTTTSVIDDFWLFNATLMLRPRDASYEFGVYVNNAFDETYEETRNAFSGTAQTATPQPTLTYGVRLSWRY